MTQNNRTGNLAPKAKVLCCHHHYALLRGGGACQWGVALYTGVAYPGGGLTLVLAWFMAGMWVASMAGGGVKHRSYHLKYHLLQCYIYFAPFSKATGKQKPVSHQSWRASEHEHVTYPDDAVGDLGLVPLHDDGAGADGAGPHVPGRTARRCKIHNANLSNIKPNPTQRNTPTHTRYRPDHIGRVHKRKSRHFFPFFAIFFFFPYFLSFFSFLIFVIFFFLNVAE